MSASRLALLDPMRFMRKRSCSQLPRRDLACLCCERPGPTTERRIAFLGETLSDQRNLISYSTRNILCDTMLLGSKLKKPVVTLGT